MSAARWWAAPASRRKTSRQLWSRRRQDLNPRSPPFLNCRVLPCCCSTGLPYPMSRLSFESTETVIFDPVAANRTATRTALFSLGFRKIEAVATLDALTESIRRRPPDLALCEAHGQVDEVCTMIQALRQGTTGYNPFIVIIVTAWEQNQGLVRRVLDSGADDLLLR